MHPGNTHRLRAGLSSAVVLALAWALHVAGDAQARTAPPDGVLSPRLAELAKPAVRDAPPAEQASMLGLAQSGSGSLIREGGRVLVSVRFDHGAIASLPDLQAVGSQVIDASRRYQSVTVAVAPADLNALEGIPGIASVTENRAPLLFTAGEGPCEGGSVISEGLGQLKVGEARDAFGLRGKGITVGVLSDSYDVATEAADESGSVATHAQQDIVSNDLPGLASTCSDQQIPVNVLAEGPSSVGEDEGRAMLQIVHDLAPHAKLGFATAFKSEISFAQNIERLAKPVSEGGAGANVIVDDVAWFEEPFFQDGPVAAAINNVTAEGVVYLTAAGNDNLFDSEEHEIASWEVPEYRDSGECPSALEGLAGFNGTHCMNFSPAGGPDPTFGITVKAHATLTVDLQWSEPWGGVSTDLDAFLLSGSEFLASSYEDNSSKTGTQRPVEIVQWTNEASSAQTVQLVINRFSGANPRLKFILLENGSGVSATEYPESSGEDVVGPTVFGHAGDANALAVGAVRYNNSAQPERYSSRGPVAHYFEPVKGTTPAAALGAPETIAKPDFVATDCGATTFFAQQASGKWRFCGTSAAAPHAAGIATLLLQGKPGATPTQVRDAMTGSAALVGVFSSDAVGAGLLDAHGAMELFGISPIDEDPESTVVPPLEGEPEETASAPAASPSVPPITLTPTKRRKLSTFFRKHPRAVVRTRARRAKVVFRFGANERGVVFRCSVDGGPYHPCPARFVHRFSLGRHTVRVKARDADGNVDRTPAVFDFKVKRFGHRSAGHRRVAHRGRVRRGHRP
jgi:subtilisin family serine protease